MKKINESVKTNSTRPGGKQPQKRGGNSRKTWFSVDEERSRFELAVQLHATAERAAGLMRSMQAELWSLYNTMPCAHPARDRMRELEETVRIVVEDLAYRAENNVADHAAYILDAMVAAGRAVGS